MNTRRRTHRCLRVLLLSLLLFGTMAAPAFISTPELKDLDGLDELRSAFNRDQEKPRVVLLLSPT